MSLWEKPFVSLVSTAHFRPAATGGPTCSIVITALDDCTLTVTKAEAADQLLLAPDGYRPRLTTLDEVLRRLTRRHRAMIGRRHPTYQ